MKAFTATDPQGHEGETNTWLTPLHIINALGPFDLDPCGFPGHPTAARLICLPEDGLSAEWEGRVWLNPPYGRSIKVWLDKLADHGNGVALVFGRTDTAWFHSVIQGASAVRFLRGRLKFLTSEKEEKTNAGSPSILIAFGDHNAQAIENVPGITLWRRP